MWIYFFLLFLPSFTFTRSIQPTGRNAVVEMIMKDKIVMVAHTKIKQVKSVLQCQQYFLSTKKEDSGEYFNLVKRDNGEFDCQILPTGFVYEDSKYENALGSNVYRLLFHEENITQLQLKRNCQHWKSAGYNKNGVYTIQIKGHLKKEVNCDMQTDGGGWTVIQQRLDAFLNFNRSWEAYKNGFGNVSSSFWIGNEFLHHLTSVGENSVKLRIEVTSSKGEVNIARFNSFKIASEVESYKLLELVAITSNEVTNDFIRHSGKKFSTWDRHNALTKTNCGKKYASGWWFGSCYFINLNVPYNRVAWFAGERKAMYIGNTKMMIRS